MCFALCKLQLNDSGSILNFTLWDFKAACHVIFLYLPQAMKQPKVLTHNKTKKLQHIYGIKASDASQCIVILHNGQAWVKWCLTVEVLLFKDFERTKLS